MTVASFTYSSMPCRVLHGAGRIAALGDELARLGVCRAMVACTPRRRGIGETLAARFPDRVATVCDAAEIFVPIRAVERGRQAAKDSGADGLVSYGGGSAVGLAKAIALEQDLPIVSIVTTYSGSETTALQGIVGADGVRTNYRSPRLLPRTLIHDPELTVDLPADISIASGLNAVSHAVSSFLSADSNPVSDMMGEVGIREMSAALTGIAANPKDLGARSQALLGSLLCGLTLMASGTTIHHKVVHVLGGGYGLAHGPTHGVILPHSTAYNRLAAPNAMKRIARAFGTEASDGPLQLFNLLGDIGAPSSLKDLGLPKSVLGEAADRVMLDRYPNPHPYDPDRIRVLLDDAWHGRQPTL